jgi:hypothetical protein
LGQKLAQSAAPRPRFGPAARRAEGIHHSSLGIKI